MHRSRADPASQSRVPPAYERPGTGEALREALRELRIEQRILNDAVAEAAGLNPRDLDILDVIDREGTCTPSHLATRTGYRRATLTGILSRLERDGWVRREQDATDGRSARLRSTDRVEELRALYSPADSAVQETLALEDAELTGRLIAALRELSAALRAVDPGAR